MYTMSFDASLKCKSGDVSGLLTHIARDADERDLNHANPNINKALSGNNITLYYDQVQEKFRRCTDAVQIIESLEDRLTTIKKPLRKDAVIARPLVLQLDPEYYKDNPDAKGSTKVMLQWACDTFGEQNIVGVSMHSDEDAPHMHLLFTPVTDDGRLSQKDWFESPKTLRAMHDDLRNYMNQHGYNIDLERKKPGKHAKRMPEAEYRDFKQLQSDASLLESKRVGLSKQESKNDEREQQLKQREELLQQQQRKLEEREAALDASQEALNARISDLRAKAEELDTRELKLDSEVNERVKEGVNKRWELEKRAEATQDRFVSDSGKHRRLPGEFEI